MGGCASKKGVVGSERLDGVPGDSPGSLTFKPQSSASGVAASTGSQLRSAARTAWQTSARSLRMSLNRSRKRQESYRMRSKTSGTSDVEDDEIDSAGCGGRPAQRGRRTSQNGVTPAGRSASSDPAGTTATGGIAWESSAELDTQTSAGRARGRHLIDTAKAAGIDGAAAAAAAAAAGAAAAADDPVDSCVRSFHVTGRGTDDLDDSRAEAEDPYSSGTTSAAAAVAAAGDQAARRPQPPQQQHPHQQQQRRTRGTAGASADGGPASATAAGQSPPNGWAADGAARAPRTSSPAGYDGGGGGGGRHQRASMDGGGGGWTAPLAPPGAVAAAAAAAAAASPGPVTGGGGGSVPGLQDGATAAAAAPAETIQWVIRPGPPIESAYVLGDVLGKGSFGVVRQATHVATGTKVAVKTIRKALLGAAEVSSLRREVEILHHLSGHPHISQLLGVYEEATQLHLVLELYQGGDLFDAIIAVGRHSERAAADVMRTVLTAISYCHAMGVAHRDIKPENFMLTAPVHPALTDQPQRTRVEELTAVDLAAADCQEQAAAAARGGGGEGTGADAVGSRLKLIDFGLSVFCADATPMTDTVGTSYYVAPEVLYKCYSRSADVWSAGVILHILLTGYAPFDGRNDQEILRAVQTGKLDLSTDPIWTSISRDARMVLLSMLNRDPAARATADQLLAMPWLGRTAAACTASSTPLPGVVSERMRRFARMNSFKKEARRVVAGLMRPEEVAGLVAQFRGLDADGDGKLSVQELTNGLARQELQLQSQGGGGGGGGGGSGAVVPGVVKPLREEELRQLVERADLNGDGMLDQSEFLGAAVPTAAISRQAQHALAAARSAAAAAGGRPGSRSVAVAAAATAAAAGNPLAAAFAHFDADGSGFITPDELRSALSAHHPNGQGPDVKALLSRVDRDDDGRISYVEFLEMMVQEVDEDDEVYDGYDSYGSGIGAGGGSLAVPKPGVIRRDAAATAGGTGGRLAQPVVQRLRGAHAVGSSTEKASQQQQQHQLAFGGAGGCRTNGKHHHHQQPHQRRQHAAQHDEDMVPYEQLPADTRVGGVRGRGAGAAVAAAGGGGGFVGGPGGAAGRSRAAAWGVGRPSGAAASSAAAVAAVRSRREAAATATVAAMPAPRGQNTTTSFHSTAAVRSCSGGVQSLDWYDECRTDESGEVDVGSDVGWVRDDAGQVGAGNRQCSTTQYGGGRGAAATGAAGGYIPSRLSPLGPMGGGAAGPAGAGQGGVVKAAEAAALTLMTRGKDPDSLLQQITESGAAPSATYRGAAAPGNGFLAGGTAQRPPPLVIPQPVAARRARRHSAAEALDDSTYAGRGVDEDTAADGGRFGVLTDRVMCEARMSEGNANAQSRGPLQHLLPHQHQRQSKPPGGGCGGGNLAAFHSGPNALRLGMANPKQWQPDNDRSRCRQVQARPVEPFAAAERQLSSGSGSSPSAATATATAGRPAGNNLCSPRASAVPLHADLSPASATAALQHHRARVSVGGGPQPAPAEYLIPPSGDSRSGRLNLMVPQAPWTPSRVAPAPAAAAASHPSGGSLYDGGTAPRRGQPYSGGGGLGALGGFGAGERRPGAVSSPYDGDEGYAVQDLTLLPPGACGDDVDGAMQGSHGGSRQCPVQPTAVGGGFASEPLPSLSPGAQRGQRREHGSSWSGDGVGDGGGGGSGVRQRGGGGSNNTTGVHEHMVLQSKLPSWDEESVEFA